MRSLFQLALVASSFFATSQACLGWEGGLPVATGTQTSSSPIRVPAGTVYDGGWKKFDRGNGACRDGEGGMFPKCSPFFSNLFLLTGATRRI
jgi:pectate lyase